MLLVDDEELVRASTADMLCDIGYSVVEVASAEQAIELLSDGLSSDLMITDHLMPGMNGAELARITRVTRPKLPILIVSGFAEHCDLSPSLTRLAMPFRRHDLVRAITACTGEELS